MALSDFKWRISIMAVWALKVRYELNSNLSQKHSLY
jgi:hypothetical protein